MLYQYLKPVFRMSMLQTKMRFFPRLPFIGKSYRKAGREKDFMRAVLMKSQLQQQVMKHVFGQSVAGVAFESYNGFLVNGLSDVIISQSLGFSGSYDKEKIEYLLTLINPDSCVYIIGAHIGTLTIPI